tara:strand:- start:2721 stop:3071 length:351 start_codon:yes stop_codon:yes gene_type:complete
MFTQNKKNVYDLIWNKDGITYRDIFLQSEKEFSKYNFELANTQNLFTTFDILENEAKDLLNNNLVLPAYDHGLKASHVFNILDSRGAISVVQRAEYISRIREIIKQVGEQWVKEKN